MPLPIRRNREPEQWPASSWPARSWDPFAEFQQLWDRMGQLFEQTTEGDTAAWRPLAETEETPDSYLVRAELPGLHRDDVNVELNGNELCISGEIKQEEKGNTLRRRSGRYVYRTSLPTDADTEKIEGELADGVLTVRVPKSAQARARRITIKG